MILLEYEAKDILKKHGIPTPYGMIVKRVSDALDVPCVLKSQVPTGGRGKLGGIRVIEAPDELPTAVQSLLSLDIKGYIPSTILAEEKLEIDKEFYLSIVIDRANATLQLVAHKNGGVEVEANDPDGFLKIDLLTTTPTALGEQLAELYDIPGQTFALQDLAEKLQNCFIKNDATLIEINPLVLTTDDKLVAGDCKMTLDDAAAFRHPEWNFEQTPASANFVTLSPYGTVATIANGAGLAMATIDAVAAAGLKPANFLDIGGSATTDSILASLRRITDLESVEAIVINIFGGIVRCDEVANAIIEAKNQLTNLPPLYIRLAGNNSLAAKMILDSHGIKLYDDLADCLEAIK